MRIASWIIFFSVLCYLQAQQNETCLQYTASCSNTLYPLISTFSNQLSSTPLCTVLTVHKFCLYLGSCAAPENSRFACGDEWDSCYSNVLSSPSFSQCLRLAQVTFHHEDATTPSPCNFYDLLSMLITCVKPHMMQVCSEDTAPFLSLVASFLNQRKISCDVSRSPFRSLQRIDRAESAQDDPGQFLLNVDPTTFAGTTKYWFCDTETCSQCDEESCPKEVDLYESHIQCSSQCPSVPYCYVCTLDNGCAPTYRTACLADSAIAYSSEQLCLEQCTPKNALAPFLTCGYREEYRDCGSTCPPSCQNIHRTCSEECARGCFCTEGYIREELSGTCIRRENCVQNSEIDVGTQPVWTCDNVGKCKVCTECTKDDTNFGSLQECVHSCGVFSVDDTTEHDTFSTDCDHQKKHADFCDNLLDGLLSHVDLTAPAELSKHRDLACTTNLVQSACRELMGPTRSGCAVSTGRADLKDLVDSACQKMESAKKCSYTLNTDVSAQQCAILARRELELEFRKSLECSLTKVMQSHLHCLLPAVSAVCSQSVVYELEKVTNYLKIAQKSCSSVTSPPGGDAFSSSGRLPGETVASVDHGDHGFVSTVTNCDDCPNALKSLDVRSSIIISSTELNQVCQSLIRFTDCYIDRSCSNQFDSAQLELLQTLLCSGTYVNSLQGHSECISLFLNSTAAIQCEIEGGVLFQHHNRAAWLSRGSGVICGATAAAERYAQCIARNLPVICPETFQDPQRFVHTVNNHILSFVTASGCSFTSGRSVSSEANKLKSHTSTEQLQPLSGISPVVSDCPYIEDEHCTANWDRISNFHDVVSVFSNGSLESVCNQLIQVEACSKNTCVPRHLYGILNVFGFVCQRGEAGRLLFMQQESCFARLATQPDFTSCPKISRINYALPNLAFEVCQRVSEYLTCTFAPTVQLCGVVSANYLRTLHMEFARGYGPDCSIPEVPGKPNLGVHATTTVERVTPGTSSVKHTLDETISANIPVNTYAIAWRMRNETLEEDSPVQRYEQLEAQARKKIYDALGDYIDAIHLVQIVPTFSQQPSDSTASPIATVAVSSPANVSILLTTTQALVDENAIVQLAESSPSPTQQRQSISESCSKCTTGESPTLPRLLSDLFNGGPGRLSENAEKAAQFQCAETNQQVKTCLMQETDCNSSDLPNNYRCYLNSLNSLCAVGEEAVANRIDQCLRVILDQPCMDEIISRSAKGDIFNLPQGEMLAFLSSPDVIQTMAECVRRSAAQVLSCDQSGELLRFVLVVARMQEDTVCELNLEQSTTLSTPSTEQQAIDDCLSCVPNSNTLPTLGSMMADLMAEGELRLTNNIVQTVDTYCNVSEKASGCLQSQKQCANLTSHLGDRAVCFVETMSPMCQAKTASVAAAIDSCLIFILRLPCMASIVNDPSGAVQFLDRKALLERTRSEEHNIKECIANNANAVVKHCNKMDGIFIKLLLGITKPETSQCNLDFLYEASNTTVINPDVPIDRIDEPPNDPLTTIRKCYQCNSLEQPACAELTSNDDRFLKQCELFRADGAQTQQELSGCRKIEQWDDAGQLSIIRMCAFGEPAKDWQQVPGSKTLKRLEYHCSNEDGCNHAETHTISLLTLCIMSGFVHFFV